MGVTIKDIASKVGVSYATVSRALNNHPEVSKETRRKVLEAVETMGYKPNALAQSLVKNESKTIGLIIPDITNPFFPEVARGVEDAAIKEGYSVFLCNTNWSDSREKKYFEVLLQKQVDGIIISSSSIDDSHINEGINSGTKIVFISKGIEQRNCTSVNIDNVSGAKLAAEYLISKGHKRIAYIGGNKELIDNKERLLGYKNALQQNNIEICQKLIKFGDFKRDSGHNLMTKLLVERPRPTAVFAANDLLALGAIQSIKEKGLNIPEDIAIVGFDDIEFASLPEIQLTTVAQPKYNMGLEAFKALYDLIKSPDFTIGKKVLLDPNIIVRKTSG